MRKISQALISVSDKSNLKNLLKALKRFNIKIISSGGTYTEIKKLGFKCREVSDFTGFQEILDGRVKTLHPKIHAGILNKRNNKSHKSQMKIAKFENIDLVVVNFYPFEKTIKKTKDHKKIIENIYKKAEEHNCEILIPEDCMVGTDFEGNGKNKNLNEIEDNEIILDIGFNTIKSIQKKINASNTVLWNGPAGYFENENFSKGTMSIAESISKNTLEKSLISVIGGGDTLAAINKSNDKLIFSHLSTAGGAFLEYLEGKDLPGISVLK